MKWHTNVSDNLTGEQTTKNNGETLFLIRTVSDRSFSSLITKKAVIEN